MKALEGIYAWVWRSDWHGESVTETVNRAVAAGLSGLFVRAWNGERATAPDGFDFQLQYQMFVQAGIYAKVGFKIIPWTYVYGPAEGNDPIKEAESFVRATENTPVRWEPPAFILDIEHEGGSREYGGRGDAVDVLLHRMKQLVGKERVVVSTYDLPSLHGLRHRRDGIAYDAIQDHAAAAIPQLYFADRTQRGKAGLTAMVEDWQKEGLDLPLYPSIQGYGISTDEALEVFTHTQGCSVWRWDKITPPIWQAIAEHMRTRPADPVPTNWEAEYRKEHALRLDDLAAGTDATRLANQLSRSRLITADHLAELARLNTYFAGRG